MTVRASRVIEDFFKGLRMVVGGLLAFGIVLLVGLFLLVGAYMAYTYDLRYLLVTFGVVIVIIGTPILLILLGHRFRKSK